MDLKPEDFINIRDMNAPPKRSLEPPIDMAVSKIVGKKVYTQDPRLLKLVVKWKGNKPENSQEPDNFLYNPKFIEELKEIFNK